MESDQLPDIFQKVNRIKEVEEIFQSNNFKSVFKSGFRHKPPTGVTFRLQNCINKYSGTYIGIPDFDSKQLLTQQQLDEIARFVELSIRSMCFDLKRKLNIRYYVTSDWLLKQLYNNVGEDLYFDLGMYLKNGAKRWSKYDQMENCCAKCLGLLTTTVMVDGYVYNVSRPYITKISKNHGYDTFQFEGYGNVHLVDWAIQHGSTIEFKNIPGYDEGFRHIAQLYKHNHNHYFKHIEFEDDGFLKKGLTTATGQYITSCLIENMRSLCGKYPSFRALTGIYPPGRCYNQLISEYDRLIYKANTIVCIFGFYKLGDPNDVDFLTKIIEEMMLIVGCIDDELWNIIFAGKFILTPEMEKFIKTYFPEFLMNMPTISINKVDRDDEILKWLNTI